MTDLLAEVLASCDRHGNAPAIGDVSYAELARRIRAVAGSLVAEGMSAGDRVLFSVRPGLDAVVLALGIVAAGGTVVFADPGAGQALFRARSALAAPRWVAAESLLYAASTRVLRPLARRRGIDLPDYRTVVPHARHLVVGPWLPGVPRNAPNLRRMISTPLDQRNTADDRSRGHTDPHAEALIIFTSGTTEHPRAVVHSRASLGAGLAGFAEAVGFVPGETVLTDQLMVGIPALIAGAHWMFPPVGADPGARPEAYVPLLADADVLFAVPAALGALLPHLRGTALRMIVVGGAPVLRPLLERVRDALPGTAVRAVYGMTEVLPVAIADGAEKLAMDAPGDYVGRLAPHVAVRIDDGEVVVSGEGVALQYLGEPPLSEVRTGDLGRLDGDRLTLLGRAKEMFIRGTTNVYPALYEPVIAGLPGVDEAAMVGIPDRFGDDAIVLAFTGTATEDAVAAALPGLIDAAVLPDRVVRVDAFPTAGRSRKLDRAELARRLG